jgi:hypothetical protein
MQRIFSKKKGIIILVISENLTIIKTIPSFPGYLYIDPDPKCLTNNSINLKSLSCWLILNLNCTRVPILLDNCWVILTSKFPSPLVNPDIRLLSGMFSVLITGPLTREKF